MTDLPRRDFTPLAPPAGGSADARRRGRLRRRRQQRTAGAAALAVVASVLGATVISTSTSAIDRLEPAPFASAAAGPEESGVESSPTPAAPEASAVPGAGASSGPAPEPTSEAESEPAPAAQPSTQAAPDGQPALSTAGPRLVRTYDPPTGNDTTVCGGRISSGIGPPRAQTGWCVMADVQQKPGGTDFSVRVCRSSEAEAADLHVDAGAVLMRLEQDSAVVWRLPPVEEPAAVLRTEPAGCWGWTWAWDGRGDDGAPVPAGASVLLVDALAEEVRDFGDQEQFTHEG